MTDQHVRDLTPQTAQADQSVESRVAWAQYQAEAGPAYAVMSPDGVICVGGICEAWVGRGIAWTLIAAHAGKHMVGLTRVVRKYVEDSGFKRVEMYVDPEHPAASRWARLLGFDLETPEPMRHFSPAGRSAYLFGRIL